MNALADEKIPSLLEKLKDGSCTSEDEITSAVTKVVEACRVPHLEKSEDIPYDASDFENVANIAEYHLTILCRILEELSSVQKKGQKFSTLFMRNIVVSCLLVASEFTELQWDWSSEKAVHAAEGVTDRLCCLAGFTTLGDLLNGIPAQTDSVISGEKFSVDVENNVNYLEYILQTLTKTLNKKSWKTNAASKASYWFILTRLNKENLSNSLPYMLPPALFIVDDWEQRNKIFGLKSLLHILTNTTGSEIRWYGRAVVIYEAIKNLLHSRETEVIEVLYPTIVLAAKVLEADPEYSGQLRSRNSFDAIMQQLIQEMRYEQNLALRVAFSAALPTLLDPMGIFAVKWSGDIIPMCEDYLATYSGPMAEDRINILKAMQVYIRKCWPQIHVNAASILKMIIRLLYDITDHEFGISDQIKENLVTEALQVVRLLYAAAPKTTKELYEGVKDIDVHPQCSLLLREIENIISCEA